MLVAVVAVLVGMADLVTATPPADSVPDETEAPPPTSPDPDPSPATTEPPAPSTTTPPPSSTTPETPPETEPPEPAAPPSTDPDGDGDPLEEPSDDAPDETEESAPDEEPPDTRATRPSCRLTDAVGSTSTRSQIRCLQRHLIYNGRTGVSVTGVWDSTTSTAVRRYQWSVGLLRRSTANKYTLWMLGAWGGTKVPPFPCKVTAGVGPGSPTTPVKCLQSRLIHLGYTNVSITGTWNKKTRVAVRRYQRSIELPIRGTANPYTLWKMGIWKKAAAPRFPCSVTGTVHSRSSARAIRCLQSRLIHVGYGSVSKSGTWNKATSKALKRFERKKGMLTLGKATPTSSAALGIWGGAASRPAKVGHGDIPRYGSVRNIPSRQVALSFDDGPAIPYTNQLLDILAAHEVPATFYVVGVNISFGSAALKRTARDGHSIQVHAWDHATFTGLSDYSIGRQVTRTSSAVKQVTGRQTSCYRPPGGSTNSRVRAAAAAAGHAPEIMWNVDPQDWRGPSASSLVSHILSRADGRGLNIVMHDGGGRRSSTVAAMPAIISGLKARGYTFVQLCRG